MLSTPGSSWVVKGENGEMKSGNWFGKGGSRQRDKLTRYRCRAEIDE